LSRGVKRNYTDEIFNRLKRELASAMRNGTYFETIATNGWAAQASSQLAGFSAAVEYNEEIGVTSAELLGYKVSDPVVDSLSTAVSSSIIEYTALGCELRCPQMPENSVSTAFGWRWIHLIFDTGQEELVMSVETCETYCLSHPDDFPQCPPGRCADPNCTVCFSGSFADPEVDRIASSFASTQVMESDTGGGISTGAVVGIACGLAIVAVVAGVASYRWWISQHKREDIVEVENVNVPANGAERVTPAQVGTTDAPAILAELVTARDVTQTTTVPDSETLVAYAMPLPGPDYKDQVNEARDSGTHDVASHRRRAKATSHPKTNASSPVTDEAILPAFKDQAQSFSR
jgi:hypothetical protein